MIIGWTLFSPKLDRSNSKTMLPGNKSIIKLSLPNIIAAGGIDRKRPNGINLTINWFIDSTVEATIIPEREDRNDPKTIAIKSNSILRLLMSKLKNTIVKLEKIEITAIEMIFAKIYSSIFKGVTNKKLNTFSLFSKRIITPMKIIPKATGSENIITAANMFL